MHEVALHIHSLPMPKLSLSVGGKVKKWRVKKSNGWMMSRLVSSFCKYKEFIVCAAKEFPDISLYLFSHFPYSHGEVVEVHLCLVQLYPETKLHGLYKYIYLINIYIKLFYICQIKLIIIVLCYLILYNLYLYGY